MVIEKQITLYEVDREEILNNPELERKAIMCINPLTKAVTIGFIIPERGVTASKMLEPYNQNTKFYIM